MITRETSVQAYNAIKDNGLLSALRFKVYSCLFHHGPLTQAECSKLIGNTGENQGITPRFAELKKQGVIVETGKRQCTLTGRTVFEWGVTGKLPIKLEKRKTSKQIIKELQDRIQELEQEIAALRGGR